MLRREKKEVFKSEDSEQLGGGGAGTAGGASDTGPAAAAAAGGGSTHHPTTMPHKNDLIVWLRLKPMQSKVYQAFLNSGWCRGGWGWGGGSYGHRRYLQVEGRWASRGWCRSAQGTPCFPPFLPCRHRQEGVQPDCLCAGCHHRPQKGEVGTGGVRAGFVGSRATRLRLALCAAPPVHTRTAYRPCVARPSANRLATGVRPPCSAVGPCRKRHCVGAHPRAAAGRGACRPGRRQQRGRNRGQLGGGVADGYDRGAGRVAQRASGSGACRAERAAAQTLGACCALCGAPHLSASYTTHCPTRPPSLLLCLEQRATTAAARARRSGSASSAGSARPSPARSQSPSSRRSSGRPPLLGSRKRSGASGPLLTWRTNCWTKCTPRVGGWQAREGGQRQGDAGRRLGRRINAGVGLRRHRQGSGP